MNSEYCIEHAAHPLSRPQVFSVEYGEAVGESTAPQSWSRWFDVAAEAPVARDESRRGAVRDLLRYGGHKPTGRGKPASEYLLRAVEEGRLGGINVAVDAGNIVSLHSGLPISVVDLDCARAPFSIAVAARGASYVFNTADQEIDVGGLLCLADAEGPCANAVKDSQRTKTTAATRRTLNVIWGPIEHEQSTQQACQWFTELLGEIGAVVQSCRVQYAGDK